MAGWLEGRVQNPTFANRLKSTGMEAAISTLIPQLSCRRCCPNPTFAELIRLKARSTALEPRRARL